MIFNDYIYVLNEHEDDELVDANIDILNLFFDGYVAEDEVCQDALYSYYVDYYLAQVLNGGFSQFIYNTQNSEQIQNYVHTGLQLMNAQGHLELFEKAIDNLKRLSSQEMDLFLSGEYFGDDHPQRDFLNKVDDLFDDLQETEDLFEINGQWLMNHPKLKRISEDDLIQLIEETQQKIPNLAEREQLAYENRPQYQKMIEALCEKAGLDLESINAGIPTDEEGIAWYFSTDKGVFYAMEMEDKAILFDGETETETKVLEITLTEI